MSKPDDDTQADADEDIDLLRQISVTKEDPFNVSVDGDANDGVEMISGKMGAATLSEDPVPDDLLEGSHPVASWLDPVMPQDWAVGTDRRVVVTGIDGRGQLYAQNPQDWKVLDRTMGFFYESLYSDLVSEQIILFSI